MLVVDDLALVDELSIIMVSGLLGGLCILVHVDDLRSLMLPIDDLVVDDYFCSCYYR